MSIFRIGRLLNKILMSRGMKITTTGLSFWSADQICHQANLHNMSVADYVESENAKIDPRHIGGRDRILERVLRPCSLCEASRILEIGPGTARYMEEVLRRFPNSDYEIYETAQDWATYIQNTYGVRFRVKIHPADGQTLSPTKTASCDLVHAHGVFVYLPICVTLSYWDEMVRVCKKGGIIAFDMFCDSSFGMDVLRKCIKNEMLFPVVLSETFVAEWAQSHGLTLIDHFDERYGFHISNYHIFKK